MAGGPKVLQPGNETAVSTVSIRQVPRLQRPQRQALWSLTAPARHSLSVSDQLRLANVRVEGIVSLATAAARDALDDSGVASRPPKSRVHVLRVGWRFATPTWASRWGTMTSCWPWGVEKMSEIPTGDVTAALSTAGDEALEMRTGLTFPGTFAMIMEEHMTRYGTTREQIAQVSVKNHGNGVTNPKAQFRKPTSVEEVVNSRFVAEPDSPVRLPADQRRRRSGPSVLASSRCRVRVRSGSNSWIWARLRAHGAHADGRPDDVFSHARGRGGGLRDGRCRPREHRCRRSV